MGAWSQEGKPEGSQNPPPSPPRPAEAPPPGLHWIPFEGDPDWSFHYQGTAIEQARGRIHSPYAGPLSLQEHAEHAMSYTTTIFLGRRLWSGASLYFDPEIASGEGLSHASGIAGFPNGEITRVNQPPPTPYVARLYVRQSLDLGGELEKVDPGPNQLSDQLSNSRLDFRFGKMGVGDVFDTNSYAHDPRTQFLNWGLFDDGAWDYPADTRGYTIGPTVELVQPSWSLRYGCFLMPRFANGLPYDYAIAQNHGQVVEAEERWSFAEHPGGLRVFAWLNNARMGDYRETINDPSVGMDVTRTRRSGRAKYGFGLNAEQELTKEVGVFLRAGWDDGKSETFAFTEIDRTLTPGLSVKGTLWGRPEDAFGMAYMVNGLSGDHRAYLSRGGAGFIIGDGQLHYGFEQVFECYYAFKIMGTLTLSADYQFVENPAYNHDRGPVNIIALRVHVEF
jgi:high affinity Mn2+ porin